MILVRRVRWVRLGHRVNLVNRAPQVLLARRGRRGLKASRVSKVLEAKGEKRVQTVRRAKLVLQGP